ncbi:hypothetical protein J19TS2_59280 [Cohnella xylanilytica]|nr:hypothetical protein J19TS2_59280 [Cohnella xylanilytica]
MEFGDRCAPRSEEKGLAVLLVGTDPLLTLLETELRKTGCAPVRLSLTGAASGSAEPAWGDAIREARWVLFASDERDSAELPALEEACRQARIPLLPAVLAGGMGVAGPLVDPDSGWGWEAARRRLRLPAQVPESANRFRADDGTTAMLANVLVSEWLLECSEPGRSRLREGRLYLLDMRTAEGSFHSFYPHPLAGGTRFSPRRLAEEWLMNPDQDRNPEPESESGRGPGLELGPDPESEPNGSGEVGELHVFGRLTSPVTGILRVWDEGDLKQLPLSLCRARAADPLAVDGASLLPEEIGAGLTHREARKEAGFAGIEAYVARMAGSEKRMERTYDWFGIGAGGTVPEAFNRALRQGLARRLEKAAAERPVVIRERRLGTIEDVHCRYCWRALAIELGTPPVLGEGEACLGFPTMWVRAGGRWHGGVGLNRTLALRSALQSALLSVCPPRPGAAPAAKREVRTTAAADESPPLDIPETEEMASARLAEDALRIVKTSRCRLSAYDLALEPFLRREFAGVIGLVLEEEI